MIKPKKILFAIWCGVYALIVTVFMPDKAKSILKGD